MTETMLTEDELLNENLAELFGLDTTTTPETGDIKVTQEQKDPQPADGAQAAPENTNEKVVNLEKTRVERPQGIKRLKENHRARCAADIQPRDIDWFWNPYLPRGML